MSEAQEKLIRETDAAYQRGRRQQETSEETAERVATTSRLREQETADQILARRQTDAKVVNKKRVTKGSDDLLI